MEPTPAIWIEHHKRAELVAPVAIVGSPGLRSIGKLVVDKLIAETRAQLIAELYSTHLPSIYQTAPSYAANPRYPGVGGALVHSASAALPRIPFYASSKPELILVAGYHPNFEGHYDVAETVVRLLRQHHVKRLIVVAGYGSTGNNVVCAANNARLIHEMKEKFNVEVGYEGPFMGFSGLVFGLAERQNIEALCLFAATTPTEEGLEFPDHDAADRVVEQLRKILKLH